MSDNDIERLLSAPEIRVDTERALARLRARVEAEHLSPVAGPPAAGPRRQAAIWLKGLAAAAAVGIVAIGLTASGVADTILTIFEPKQVVAIPITSGELGAVAGLESFGTLTWSTPPRPHDVPDLATAQRESGLSVLTPATLPPGTGSARFAVIPATTATYTFSASSTVQAAARYGRTPPPMPANIDGSKLFISGGPAVLQTYGDGTSAPSSAPDPRQTLSALIVAQGKAPVVKSDGVTVEELQAYLLQQPGISPQLAAQIRGIKDPTSTLPIPVPVDMANSHKVQVQGTSGVFVGDSTGLGSAVIWQKGDIVYGVAGTLTEEQILAVANSLH